MGSCILGPHSFLAPVKARRLCLSFEFDFLHGILIGVPARLLML